MVKQIQIIGLIIDLIASVLLAYGRIFKTREAIEKESKNTNRTNQFKAERKLEETRIAQVGAILLTIGFSIQIVGLVLDT